MEWTHFLRCWACSGGGNFGPNWSVNWSVFSFEWQDQRDGQIRRDWREACDEVECVSPHKEVALTFDFFMPWMDTPLSCTKTSLPLLTSSPCINLACYWNSGSGRMLDNLSIRTQSHAPEIGMHLIPSGFTELKASHINLKMRTESSFETLIMLNQRKPDDFLSIGGKNIAGNGFIVLPRHLRLKN